MTQPVKNSEKLDQFRRDLIKTCAFCGVKYHPRKNGYANLSKYCGTDCSRRALRNRFTI